MPLTIREVIESNHGRHPYIYDVMDVDKTLNDIISILEGIRKDKPGKSIPVEDVKDISYIRGYIAGNKDAIDDVIGKCK